MRQIFQNLKSGGISLEESPTPEPAADEVLIENRASLVSAGTERMLLDFGRASYLQKARQQPAKVKQVIEKIKTDGLMPTISAVLSRLDQPMPLGYSSAGIVIKTGSAITEFVPGDRVISNGPHAEAVCVPKNLCAKIPPQVSYEQAAFTVLGAVALQGVRLAAPTLGESAGVIGLGLIGLLTAQILKAGGCRVLGFDRSAARVELARGLGIEAICLNAEGSPVSAALNFSSGAGLDAVLITAAANNSEPVTLAAKISRKRGRVVLVGTTEINLDRNEFYQKELTFQVSCSYGPGRYEEAFENKGLDYPIGYVRWTEQRNFQAVLELLECGKLVVDPLISALLPFEQAELAYTKLLNDPSSLGIVFAYPGGSTPERRVGITPLSKENSGAAAHQVNLGVIGAGQHVRAALLPAFQAAGANLIGIASRHGTSAAELGRKFSFEYAASDYSELLKDPAINAILIATTNDSHAALTIAALKAGKHVLVEKPLAIGTSELNEITSVYREHAEQVLLVGFNRRYSPFITKAAQLLSGRSGPLSMIMTVNAGALPAKHWTADAAQSGGRIIGEGCHFFDLLAALAGAPISACTAALADQDGRRCEGIAALQLKFADGSVGSINYFANGHRRFPKERLEIFSDGRILVLDNFRSLKGIGFKNFTSARAWKQAKGHRELVQYFCDCITGKAQRRTNLLAEAVNVTEQTIAVSK